MEENKLPKVLSVSLSTWRSDSGIHTQTDLFKFWDPDRLAQIYTKSDLPSTPVCNRFFQISENAVIKSVLNRRPVGKRVENGALADDETKKAMAEESALYSKAHKRKSWLMTIARELVWRLGRWKTKELDAFVRDFDPDVYFIPIYPVAYMGRLQLHLLKKHPRPYVCYLSDDNYSYRACGKNIFSYIHRFMLRKVVKKLAKGSDEMFTITKTEAEDTDRLFGTHSVVLTKGIDYSSLTFCEKAPELPIRMVYTGKMIIGRGRSLVEIARAISKINKDGERITLDIYSPDLMDERAMRELNSGGTRFHGAVSKDEVAAIQERADIAVFVESLEPEYRYAARLSFSTKLTDYFKSGKCIFAIGDKDIAPIEYLREENAAIISTEYADIEKNLRLLLDDPSLITEYGKRAFECGKRNHDEPIIKERFISTIKRAAEKNEGKTK